ncbi:MAG: class I SAM-dependent methyltransferase [Bryobacteraceae bacterium]
MSLHTDCPQEEAAHPAQPAPVSGAAERASKRGPSWYLDPLAAEQKRRVFLTWILNSAGSMCPEVVLKTDLFEEANNHDDVLWDLYAAPRIRIGIDLDPHTPARAAARCADRQAVYLAADVRRLPLPPGSVDVIVSTSTLDHFEDQVDLRAAIVELARVLRPGGRLFLVLDNPRNPLYPLMRWASRRGWMPFTLGETLSAPAMLRELESAGLRADRVAGFIHNPRIFTTLLFLALRRVLGRHADGPVRALLALFALAGWLPTWPWTACFLGTCATKPAPLE